jgi:FAD/FMN-containing dehydrogenase
VAEPSFSTSAVQWVLGRLDASLVSTDAGDLTAYGCDWTRVFPVRPSAVVRPRSTEEVSAVLRLCHEAQVPVVPSGGRTGLAGGAVASHGEIVLSLERLRALGPVDTLGQTVTVGAGAVTAAVHEHAAAQGLLYPIELASKGSCQIGGNIGTNAGGVRVIRYGHTRNWVLGLTVVLADGTVLDLNRCLEKNNTGADLRQLFIGSEGTLGVVTEATLKLCRPPRSAHVLLAAVGDIAAVLRFFKESRQGPFTLSAFECFSHACLERVMAHKQVGAPLGLERPFYVLMEVEGELERLEDWLGSMLTQGLVADGTLSQDGTQARRLWTYRESISESLASAFPHKNDLALPVHALAAFYTDFERLLAERYPGWTVCIFGHIGDGNLHLNALKPAAWSIEDFVTHTRRADDDVFALVQRHGGSISAEHGIGLLKKPYLHYSRNPAEIVALRALKHALDPLEILNPGKIF